MGGLFEQFTLTGLVGESSIDQNAVRSMAAVQLAINRINNKQNGHKLLPRTKVWCCTYFAHDLLQILSIFIFTARAANWRHRGAREKCHARYVPLRRTRQRCVNRTGDIWSDNRSFQVAVAVIHRPRIDWPFSDEHKTKRIRIFELCEDYSIG